MSMIAKCRKCTRYKTILLLLMNLSYCRLSIAFTRLMCEIRSYLNRGILDRYATVSKRNFRG